MKIRKLSHYLTRCPIPKAFSNIPPEELNKTISDGVLAGTASQRILVKRVKNFIEDFEEPSSRSSQYVEVKRGHGGLIPQKRRKSGRKHAKASVVISTKHKVLRDANWRQTENVKLRLSEKSRPEPLLQCAEKFPSVRCSTPIISESFIEDPIVKSEVIFDESFSQQCFSSAHRKGRSESASANSQLIECDKDNLDFMGLTSREQPVLDDQDDSSVNLLEEPVEMKIKPLCSPPFAGLQTHRSDAAEHRGGGSNNISSFPVLPQEVQKKRDKHIPGGLAARLTSIIKEDLADMTFWKNKYVLPVPTQDVSSTSSCKSFEGDGLPSCLVLQILGILHTECHLVEAECRVQHSKQEQSRLLSHGSIAVAALPVRVVFEKSHFEKDFLRVGSVFSLMKPWISIRMDEHITILRPYFLKTTVIPKRISLLD